MDRYYSLPDSYGFPDNSDRYPGDWLDAIIGGLLERSDWLALGPPGRDLKSRFDLRLTNEDDYWIYLEIKPRQQWDRNNFKHMQLVLNRKSFQLRRLWIVQPNYGETTYDLEPPNSGSDEAMTANSILKGLPEDYKKVDLGHLFEDPNEAVIKAP